MNDGAVTIPLAALRRAVVVLAVVVLIALLGYLLLTQLPRTSGLFGGSLATQTDAQTHQAVFLVGGQVYFGKLSVRDSYVLLSDVFYLSQVEAAPGEAGQGQLIKRGAELHGPREPMIVPIAQVLFVENLRPDSEVMTAISRYHAGGPDATAPPAQPRPTLEGTPPPRGPTPSPSPTR